MRSHGVAVVFALALTGAVLACSSSSGATGPTGGHSTTIVASSTTTGGSYGSGGNYFFNPTPDTVAAGTTVNFQFGSVVHNVHFLSGPTTPDSIPATSNTTVPRSVTAAGTYTYECLIHHIGGVLVAQ
jgi:plastocyanin